MGQSYLLSLAAHELHTNPAYTHSALCDGLSARKQETVCSNVLPNQRAFSRDLTSPCHVVVRGWLADWSGLPPPGERTMGACLTAGSS